MKSCHLRHDHADNLTPYDSFRSKCIHCGQIIIGTFQNFADQVSFSQQAQSVTHHPNGSVTYHHRRYRRPSSWRRSYSSNSNLFPGDIVRNQRNTIYHPNGSVTQRKRVTRRPFYRRNWYNNLNTIDDDVVRNQRNTTYHPDGSVTQQRKTTTIPGFDLYFQDMSRNQVIGTSLPGDPTLLCNQRNTTYHPDGSVTQQRKTTTKPFFDNDYIPCSDNLNTSDLNTSNVKLDDDLLQKQTNVTHHPNGTVTKQQKVTTKPEKAVYSRKNSVYHADGSVTQVQQTINDDDFKPETFSTRVQQKVIEHEDGSVTHRKRITRESDLTCRHKIVNSDGSTTYRKYFSKGYGNQGGGYEDIIVQEDGTITRRVVQRKNQSSNGISGFSLYGKF